MTTPKVYTARVKASTAAILRAVDGLLSVRAKIAQAQTDQLQADARQLSFAAARIAELSEPPPAPPPPAPPPPAPPPPPPAPPQGMSYEIKSMPANLAMLVFIREWSPDLSRYTRGQHLLTLKGAQARVQIVGYNMASGGTFRPLLAPEYTLLADGVQVATVRPTAGANSAVFVFDADTLPSAVPELTVVPSTATGECCIPYHAEAIRGSTFGPQNGIPHSTGSYTLAMGEPLYKWGRINAPYGPVARPRTRRTAQHFNTAVPRSRLHVEHLVPLRFGDEYRVGVSADGCLNTYDDQDYHFFKQVALHPRIPELDGPRGVGSVSMVTHISIGRDDKLYVLTPNRVTRITAEGHITTLAGKRHPHPMPHHQRVDFADVGELVGDWSSIPKERQGFHELWGMAWDERTLMVDEDKAPIPTEGNEKPHKVEPGTTGPRAFVADSQRNRVCMLEFLADKHGAAKVTEFITGLQDPWDVVCTGGVLYVAERQAHRICAYDATTGALLRVVVQGAPLAVIDRNREVVRTASLETCRNAACVAPEGLYLHDGWLYFGSKAQGQIKRVRLDGSDLQLVMNLRLDDNAKFCKFFVSDGTFGPAGSVGSCLWSNADYGWPQMRLPDGSMWNIADSLPNISGLGGSFVYVSAGAIRNGYMAVGGANEGILLVSLRNADEALPSAAAARGATEWKHKGYIQVFGANGFGMTPLPLPWGASADIDAFLLHCGHARDE